MAQKKEKILIVDDTELNREILSDILSDYYEIVEAEDGMQAVEILRVQHASIVCVLLDVVMPKMDGFEVLLALHKNDWISTIPVIMISAETGSSFIDQAYDLGATDYISRPFDERVVRRRVHNTIGLYMKQKSLEILVTEQIIEKERSNYEMIEVLSNIVEFRNGESGLHVMHIRVITGILLQEVAMRDQRYGLTAQKIALISNASALHDIGKISIQEEILNKPGRLTKEEFEIMKTHSEIGAKILENSPQLKQSELIQIAHDICRWHHERYDGKGYPDGLVGDEIPIAAQVVAVADAYDALTSERVYKPAFSHERTMEMIQGGECGSFSPFLLKCLRAVGDKLKQELAIKSPRTMEAMDIRQIASEAFTHRELSNTSQALIQMEREQTKFNFIMSVSRDVLFEYDKKNDILEFSDRGAEYLGVPKTIFHPFINTKELSWIFELFDPLQDGKEITPEKPVKEYDCCLDLERGPKKVHLVIRAIWDAGEETGEYSYLIGILTEMEG